MLPFRSGRAGISSAACVFFVLALLTCAVLAAEKKGPKASSKAASPSPTAALAKKPRPKPEEGMRDVPLATGHDAKGLVLPDFDLLGRMRGKLEAGVTKRLDEQNIEFEGVKFTTFMPETQAPDLEVITRTSTLNLKTQVLKSKERTVVKRADFEIVGDTMEFEMLTRQGTLAGNVKMVVRGKARTPREEHE
ncbi:MAG TPA: hypothetical protein VJU77_01420 [Chthoniobacterales bacterium]|nr:hypothetical protein [Chthoniobacterales bacterium]